MALDNSMQLPEAAPSLAKVGDRHDDSADETWTAIGANVLALRTVLDRIGACAFVKDGDARYLYANRDVQEALNLPLDQIVGQNDTQFFDHPSGTDILEDDRRVIDLGESIEKEKTVVFKLTGDERIYRVIKEPLRDQSGEIIGMFGISTDITQRKQTERFEAFRSQILELLAAPKALDTTLDSIAKGLEQLRPGILCLILLLDAEGQRLHTGAAPSIPRSFSAAIDGVEVGPRSGTSGTAAFTGERVIVPDIANYPYWDDYKKLASDAELKACWSQPIRSSSREIIGSFSIYLRKPKSPSDYDLYLIEQAAHLASIAIERKKAEERIVQLAYYDELTELPNRRLLVHCLDLALARSHNNNQMGALILLDIDHFKNINDTKGHEIGDRMLVEVAERIRAKLPGRDNIFRTGDDEFFIVLENIGADQQAAMDRAEMIAEKIRYTLNQPYALTQQDRKHHGSVSLGVTLFGSQDSQVDFLAKQAEMALYHAKSRGRNTIRFFNDALQLAVERRSLLEAALHSALHDGELHIVYQPQVSSDQKVVGAEALLRWTPRGQLPIPPSQFIPIAEETGLIIPIGQWVLEMACRQLKLWSGHPATCDLHISINVSARQFREEDFIDQIRKCLSQTGANPALLILELTESAMADNVDEVIDRMRRIKELGVSFSLDDFGTGYSSLSYLKKMPLTQIKIDRSFVSDITTDPNDAAIVQAIISIGRSMSIQVLAEGVETYEQLAFLKLNGCFFYQGYLFSRPLPIERWPARI